LSRDGGLPAAAAQTGASSWSVDQSPVFNIAIVSCDFYGRPWRSNHADHMVESALLGQLAKTPFEKPF
jgi:hypothetical protein